VSEIKTVEGRVLYMAESATDVRTALQEAVGSGANLSGAVLSDAYLSDAVLRGADLSDAMRPGHFLWAFRLDLHAVLDAAPAEVTGLRAALTDGQIDGRVYTGDCACLVGTIAKLRDCAPEALEGLTPDGSRPAEQWFIAILPGDRAVEDLAKAAVGEGPWRASLALQWIDEWVEIRKHVGAILAEAKAA
jgi:hypothetical protein